MALLVKSVSYRDFRNQEAFDLHPSDQLTILVGPNAAGKTNCIEGICLLTNGATFRHLESSRDLIRQGAARAHVAARIAGDKRSIDVSCDVEPGKKTFTINGKRRRSSACAKIVPSVLFNPDDLAVVKGPASGRRGLFDAIGTQLSDAYARVSSDYARALSQRNALLRDERTGDDLFAAWTESLVRSGSALFAYREALVRRVAPYIVETYETIAPGEALQIAYEPCVPCEAGERAQIEEAFRAALERERTQELRRHTTVVGPHKDDVLFTIDGRPARLFGSQGQQRTVVLAAKIAHANLVRDMLGRYPVFLLDDVMSELDRSRRGALTSLIDAGMQTIVTTTNLEYFTPAERERAAIVTMGGDADAAAQR